MCNLLRSLTVASLVFSTSVAAQDMPLPSKQAEIELAGYADCVVRKPANQDKVAAFLRVLPDSEGFYPAALKAADMRCLDAAAMKRRAAKLEMRIQPTTFRQALFPALYRARFGRTGAASAIATVPAVAYSSDFDGDISALSQEYRAGRAYGDCVARATPQAAHGLLMSVPYSKQENLAVAAIKPALAECLPPDQTVHFTRSAIRAYLGEATYRLAMAAAPSAAKGGRADTVS